HPLLYPGLGNPEDADGHVHARLWLRRGLLGGSSSRDAPAELHGDHRPRLRFGLAVEKPRRQGGAKDRGRADEVAPPAWRGGQGGTARTGGTGHGRDRKSTRLNCSHGSISYAVFCLQEKNSDKVSRLANAAALATSAVTETPQAAPPTHHRRQNQPPPAAERTEHWPVVRSDRTYTPA